MSALQSIWKSVDRVPWWMLLLSALLIFTVVGFVLFGIGSGSGGGY